jgi:beta-glucosidase
MRTGDLPPFDDYGMHGRTYKFADAEPLYPFGFGLGYSRLNYGLALSATRMAAGGEVIAQATVANPTSRPATESVQCYLKPPRVSQESPRAVLVDFQKLEVPAGGSVTVTFRLGSSSFAQVDASGRPAHVPGRYEIVVGSSSPGARSLALGAPDPATAEVTLV